MLHPPLWGGQAQSQIRSGREFEGIGRYIQPQSQVSKFSGFRSVHDVPLSIGAEDRPGLQSQTLKGLLESVNH